MKPQILLKTKLLLRRVSKPGPARQVKDIEIIQAIKEWQREHDEPVVKAEELSTVLDIGPQQCRDRLRELHTEGVVEFKRSGSGKVWWVA